MNTNPHQDALRSRWTLEGTIPLSGVADGAVWHRARSVTTGEPVTLFIVRGEAALESADAVRRAYLVEDDRLMPVHEVVVLDDPREDDPGTGADSDHADEDAHPTTVVEYPLPPAPPLAAMLGQGALHPETARAVIGEAATGLEVARRRGLRHQFLDSNRIFVDPRTGTVKVLGVGVEAAAHPGLDRSREVASFQDTAALTALLYRALTGHSPRPDDSGMVPKPSAVVADGAPQIPADLDLLCELVLNETSEEIPETTRGLIAALEPWQSIPVTLEAYRVRNEPATGPAGAGREEPTADAEPEGATAHAGSEGDSAGDGPEGGAAGLAPAAAATATGAAAAGTVAAGGAAAGADATAATSAGDATTRDDVSSDDSSSDLDEDGLESTALMAAVPDKDEATASSAGVPSATPDTATDTDTDTDTDAATGTDAGADSRAHAEDEAGSQGAGLPHEGTSAQNAGSAGPGEDAVPAAEGEAAQQQVAHGSADAQAIVRDLQLDQKRSSSAFPGYLDLTVPQPPASGLHQDSAAATQHPAQPGPQPDGDQSSSAAAGAAGAAGGIAVSGGAIAQGPGGAEPEHPVDPVDEPLGAAEDSDIIVPSRRSGTHWPLVSGSAPAEQDQLAPRAAEPIRPSPDAAGHSDGTPAAASAQTPSAAVHPGPGAASPTPVTVAGRSDPASADQSVGPIVVRGRQPRALEDPPTAAAQSSQRSTLFREVISVAVDSDDPDAYAMGASQPEQRSRQSQWILLGAVLVVIVALVFAVSTITSGLRERVENPLNTEPVASAPATEEEPAEEEPTEEEPTEDEEELPPAELDGVGLLVEGSDSDPDNTDQADRITDGDPGTFWSTQHYTSPQYGGLKEGIGVRIDLAEESTLSAVVVTTARNSGGTLELRAVGEDDSLGDVLASGQFAGDGEVRLEPDEPVEAEKVALWLSELPPDSNESGRFRGRIAEIQVE